MCVCRSRAAPRTAFISMCLGRRCIGYHFSGDGCHIVHVLHPGSELRLRGHGWRRRGSSLVGLLSLGSLLSLGNRGGDSIAGTRGRQWR